MKKTMYSGLRHLLSGIVLGMFSHGAQAGSAEIRAEFRPDPANPMLNQFKNNMPSSGYCAWFTAFCNRNNLFSLDMPIGAFPQTSGGPVPAMHANPRQGAYLKVPSEWRTLTVTNERGNTEQLEVRISGIGGRADHFLNVEEIPGYYEGLWSTGRWHKAPAPCLPSGGLNGTSWFVVFFWLVPENAGACATQALFDLPNFEYRYLQFGYELRTPKPLGMPTGVYRGTIVYTAGPGMDFDLGDRVVPRESDVTLNFVLSVEHILKVEVPPGGDRIELIPQGGWQAWVQQGRRPTRLFRDQTFIIGSSSPFKIQLECQFPMGNTCGLQAASGETVPLNIAVSLPGGIGDESGQPVKRKPLLLDGSGTRLFTSNYYVDRRPGTLHFEIPASEVEPMFAPGAPDRYAGTVTVIWDSEV